MNGRKQEEYVNLYKDEILNCSKTYQKPQIFNHIIIANSNISLNSNLKLLNNITISNQELQWLKGLSDNVQTQFNNIHSSGSYIIPTFNSKVSVSSVESDKAAEVSISPTTGVYKELQEQHQHLKWV